MKNIYGFEKRADEQQDLARAASNYGFRGPEYSGTPGTPVQMSMVDPGTGARAGRAAVMGTLGGVLGGVLGDAGGRYLGGKAGNPGLGATIGAALGTGVGAGAGGAQGWYNAPPQLMLSPQEPPKQASFVDYGFSKEALAAPGLLGQMSSAVSRMGRATGIAGQRAGNAFQAGQGVGALRDAGTAGFNSLMKSQAGRRVAGTGLGLGAAGTLAAGSAAYGATQPKTPVALPR